MKEKIRKRKSRNDYITVKIDITDLVKKALTKMRGTANANKSEKKDDHNENGKSGFAQRT